MEYKFKKPYNDEKLVWNEQTNRYELTIEYVSNLFDNTFKDTGVLAKRITKNSRKIYNFIYARANSHNKEIIDFVLNNSENGRNFLIAVLTEQIEADLETGFNDLSSIPAVNTATGQVIDRNQLVLNQISVDAEQIVQSSANYFGFSIIYTAPLPYYYFLFFRKAKEQLQ